MILKWISDTTSIATTYLVAAAAESSQRIRPGYSAITFLVEFKQPIAATAVGCTENSQVQLDLGRKHRDPSQKRTTKNCVVTEIQQACVCVRVSMCDFPCKHRHVFWFVVFFCRRYSVFVIDQSFGYKSDKKIALKICVLVQEEEKVAKS